MKEARARVLWEGLVAGLLGYATVVVFVGATDLVGGDGFFHTVQALGAPLAGISSGPAPVFAYNGVHLLVFLAMGFLVAWAVMETERHPEVWYLYVFFLVFVFFYQLFFAAIYTVVGGVAWDLPWLRIIVASLLAVVVMGAYLSRSHPRLARRVREEEDPELVGR